jgi:hypothetical protein
MIIAVQTRAAAVIPAEQPHEAGVAVPGPVVEVPPAACTELTAAGEPCKGRPGADGLCAAHKRKGEDDAAGGLPPAVVGADPQRQAASEAEEAHGEEASG